MPDSIYISQLQLSTHIGVPEPERAEPQTLLANLTLYPSAGLRDSDDDLTRTIDYAAVSLSVRELAAARPRQLVETLAEEICAHLLSAYPLASVEIELRKFILPETEYVAVRIARGRSGA